ncbi:helix-turn-helix domain-containing protein [Streptomyces sp. NPDC001795]|uniref:helix-turn-helix domain-containing protein n=1 Tax=Streptomyces sp. NPDC001795 TaxID=3154525 RepID=UPI00332ECAFF
MAAQEVHNPDALAELRLRLEALRAQRGLTVTDLAGVAQLGRTTVSQALSDSGPVPSMRTVSTLARVLRLDVTEALGLLATATGRGKTAAAEGSLGRPVAQWDPYDLQVHPAATDPPHHVGGAGRPSRRSVLPGYVRRPHDEELGALVDAASAGYSQLAVVVGSSSTGKTRACWEAVQPLAATGWQLWHPLDPTPAEAVAAGLDKVTPRTVVWLNEAQHYLGASGGTGERIAAALHSLLRDSSRSPVLVLATLWKNYADAYTTIPRPATMADPYPLTRSLIEGRQITLPDAFSPAEIDQARRLASAGDRTLAHALEHMRDGRLTQFLAGAPALVSRYDNVSPAARALLHAAMDARSLGAGQDLTADFLEQAATHYLINDEYDDLGLGADWLEQALAETARPVHGSLAPLRPIRPRPPRPAVDAPRYRLADYLEQHGRITRRSTPPPPGLWQALLDHTAPEGRSDVAQAAQSRGLLRLAFLMHTSSPHPNALGDAATLLHKAGRTDEAFTWLRAHAEAGHPHAWRHLGSLQQHARNTEEVLEHYPPAANSTHGLTVTIGKGTLRLTSDEEALASYRRGADCGDLDALTAAVRMLEEAEREQEACDWLSSRADAHSLPVLAIVARLLRSLGRRDEALACYLQAVQAGDTHSLMAVANLKRTAGEVDEALCWYRRAVNAGHPAAAVQTAETLWEAGRTEQALDWFTRAADDDRTWLTSRAAAALHEARGLDQALAWLDRRAASGSSHALEAAGDLLARVGRTQDALVWYRRACAAGEPYILGKGLALLREAGHSEARLRWHQDLADAGDTYALREALRLLRETSGADAAFTWLRSRADFHTPKVMMMTADLLEKAERTDEALSWYKRAGDAGEPYAATAAAHCLRAAGRNAEALAWLATHDRPRLHDGYDHALGLTAELLQESRGVDAAVTWVQNRAEIGSPRVFRTAGDLLRTAGRLKEALDCYQKALHAQDGLAPTMAARTLKELKGVEEATLLRRYGWEPDGTVAKPWTAMALAPPAHAAT